MAFAMLLVAVPGFRVLLGAWGSDWRAALWLGNAVLVLPSLGFASLPRFIHPIGGPMLRSWLFRPSSFLPAVICGPLLLTFAVHMLAVAWPQGLQLSPEVAPWHAQTSLEGAVGQDLNITSALAQVNLSQASESDLAQTLRAAHALCSDCKTNNTLDAMLIGAHDA